ncbi:MAG: ATP phosphoribosyltransferase regulatory subunit, partial [Solirubrobacterales bacterium]
MTEDGKPGPIPPGTRDVLPDEMRELREIEAALTSEFARSGYSEVSTPTIEYAGLLGRGGRRGGPLYRFLDDRGELVALRNDMTVPIARLAAARLGEVAPPWRLSYLGSSFRTTSPRRADLRESGQAGIELIGPEDADGTAEVLTVLDRSLTGAGVSEVVICIGDASLWPSLLEESGLGPADTALCLEALARGDLVELEATLT